jgi:hypothetical protein
MRHRRRPVPEHLEIGPEVTQEPLPGEDAPMICDVCGDSRDDLLTLQNETGFVICAHCIDGLAGILRQVRRDLAESGDLSEHRRLN